MKAREKWAMREVDEGSRYERVWRQLEVGGMPRNELLELDGLQSARLFRNRMLPPLERL